MSLSYTAPTLNPSGTTFGQLQSGGLAGQLVRIALANTGLTLTALTRIQAGGPGAVAAFATLRGRVDNYLRGDAAMQADTLQAIADGAAVFHALALAADEIGALIAANPGTISNQPIPTDGFGTVEDRPLRSFP